MISGERLLRLKSLRYVPSNLAIHKFLRSGKNYKSLSFITFLTWHGHCNEEAVHPHDCIQQKETNR